MFLPLYSLVMNWVFPLKLSYRIESSRIWENTWCMSCMCLSMVTMGYHVIHLMYVLVINLWVSWPRELMHRVWHTFSSWLSGRNFGALFEVLYVGWIDEYEIVWCISYNHTRVYLVTLGFWLICVLRCYFTMNSRAVCVTYRNNLMDWWKRITLGWFRTLQ